MGSWFYIMVFYTYLIRFYDCCTVLHSVFVKKELRTFIHSCMCAQALKNRKEYWIVKLFNEQL